MASLTFYSPLNSLQQIAEQGKRHLNEFLSCAPIYSFSLLSSPSQPATVHRHKYFGTKVREPIIKAIVLETHKIVRISFTVDLRKK